MVYLRSRMYSPDTGRFLTRDTWGGNAKSPMSYNKWNYVASNPINRTDPTGKCWYPKQGGGVSVDSSDPSSGICSWFVNVFQQIGVNISPNATPNNWLASLPLNQQLLLSQYVTCPFQNNTFLEAGGDLWQVIVFYTKPKWHFYQNTNTEYIDIDLTFLGEGAEVAWSCDNDNPVCTGALSYSAGISAFKLKLKVGGELNIDTEGTMHLGATVDVGLCGLFASLTKISVTCGINFGPRSKETVEFGWQTDFPDIFWVLANASNFSSLSYEQFAKRKLPFHDQNEKIYYEIKRTGNRGALSNEYFDLINYTFP